MKELIRLLNIPDAFRAVELMRTSDGFYLARQEGDCGFNLFLGVPSARPGPGREATLQMWAGHSFGQRRRTVRAARAARCELRRFLPRRGRGGHDKA